MTDWLPRRVVEGELKCPLPQKQLQANGTGSRLFLYLRKGICAVNTSNFNPVQTTPIAKVDLSQSKKNIILEFNPKDAQYPIHAPVSIPITKKDTLVLVHNDGTRPLFISSFDVMRALRLPMWTPPAWLRFPPRHLRHFYRVTDHDPGSNEGTYDTMRYSRRIEGTDMLPLYVYSDGSFFIAPAVGEDADREFFMWRIPRDPHWSITDIASMDESGICAEVASCKVGDTECVLKTLSNLSGITKYNVARELLVSLILSIFGVGPEIYDFWYNEPTGAVYLLMKRIHGQRVNSCGEYVYDVAAKGMVGMSHDDLHPGNILVEDKTSQVVPIDFGFVTLARRAPSKTFRDSEYTSLNEKRRRVEDLHDAFARRLNPLPRRSTSRISEFVPHETNDYLLQEENRLASVFVSREITAEEEKLQLQLAGLKDNDVVRVNRLRLPAYHVHFNGDTNIPIQARDIKTHTVKDDVAYKCIRFGSNNGTRWSIRLIMMVTTAMRVEMFPVDVVLQTNQTKYFDYVHPVFGCTFANWDIIDALNKAGFVDVKDIETRKEAANDNHMDAEMLP